jgi:hypothetical protein
MIEEITSENRILLLNLQETAEYSYATTADIQNELFFLNYGFPSATSYFKLQGLSPVQSPAAITEATTDQLFYFRPKSKDLVSFNCETLTFSSFTFAFTDPIRSSAALAHVGGLSFIVFGGYDSKTKAATNVGFFIDVRKKYFQEIKRTRPRSNAMAIVVGQKCYVFGGVNGKQTLSECEFYDLGTKKWKNITQLPIALRDTATAEIGTFILISGKPNSVYLFNPAQNTFSLVANLLISNQSLVICNGENVFLLTNSLAYCNVKSISNWGSMEKEFKFGNVTARPVIRRNKAFFVDWKGVVYCFSFENLELKVVASTNGL